MKKENSTPVFRITFKQPNDKTIYTHIGLFGQFKSMYPTAKVKRMTNNI